MTVGSARIRVQWFMNASRSRAGKAATFVASGSRCCAKRMGRSSSQVSRSRTTAIMKPRRPSVLGREERADPLGCDGFVDCSTASIPVRQRCAVVQEKQNNLSLLFQRVGCTAPTTTSVLHGEMKRSRAAPVLLARLGATSKESLDRGGAPCAHGSVKRSDAALVDRVWIRAGLDQTVDRCYLCRRVPHVRIRRVV